MNNFADNGCGTFNPPKLIETGASNYLNKALLHSHKFKKEYNQYMHNITLLSITGVIVVCMVWVLYKRASVVKNNEYKHNQTQYVLNALSQLNQEIIHPPKNPTLLTGLPVWDSNL
jgi:hypothetical protein